MKNRDNKIFRAGEYYHIFNRGVGKTDIFLDESDHIFFLRRLRENVVPEKVPFSERREPSPGGYVRKEMPPGSFALICYCLMLNHFHLLIRQETDLPVSKLLLKIGTSYSKYFNQKYERIGGSFQDAFKAVNINTDSYLLWLSAYIHQNPKVAGLVENLENYQWSSYPDYIGARNGTLCEKGIILSQFDNKQDYKKFVEDSYAKIKKKKEMESLLLDE
ncbi:MAG: hypothetical protein COU35_00015 [Candidatus Magasanikbacteria bacterium CG10_big_fil_rev_8_21_14_0_10_47_10]|uniref:Transposase IS200-like domain-containing protein n=1 Tax=Candidatus Magasanikbacteria bacterium CG10_big_fil_rev_8_21_14_0_10_47_10 TaxID=1974652 RepID=A0A2H0TTN3_9BACT|nr:MAG: hypothetical protein COU35_00015 [Candidatus Magasanikbacteria bacterium CG10_big_fil_rev_8_21_14_0_10_47_10]